MEYKDQKKKIGEAKALLRESTITLEKFRRLRDILYGVHLNLDDTLHILDVRAAELGRIVGGDFLSVRFEQMPVATEDDRRRKQLVAEFGEGLKKLQVEIGSVEADLDAAQVAEKKEKKKWHFHNPFTKLRGPFFFVLGCLVFIIATLQFTSSTLTILNSGCPPVPVMFNLPPWLPGLQMPQEPIESGETAYARFPGLEFDVDASYPGNISVQVSVLHFPFDVEHIDDVQFDGMTILGRIKRISAFWSGDHTLEIICKPH